MQQSIKYSTMKYGKYSEKALKDLCVTEPKKGRVGIVLGEYINKGYNSLIVKIHWKDCKKEMTYHHSFITEATEEEYDNCSHIIRLHFKMKDLK